MEVVANNSDALRFASNKLCDDNVVIAAVSIDWLVFEFLADKFRSDEEVMMAAISNCGDAFQCASDELRGDRFIVLDAVSCCGSALQYASAELRAGGDVVTIAVSNGRALRYASPSLRHHRAVVMVALPNNCLAVVGLFSASGFKSPRSIVRHNDKRLPPLSSAGFRRRKGPANPLRSPLRRRPYCSKCSCRRHLWDLHLGSIIVSLFESQPKQLLALQL